MEYGQELHQMLIGKLLVIVLLSQVNMSLFRGDLLDSVIRVTYSTSALHCTALRWGEVRDRESVQPGPGRPAALPREVHAHEGLRVGVVRMW